MRLVILILVGVVHLLEIKHELIYLLDHGQQMQLLTGSGPQILQLATSVQESSPCSSTSLEIMLGVLSLLF